MNRLNTSEIPLKLTNLLPTEGIAGIGEGEVVSGADRFELEVTDTSATKPVEKLAVGVADEQQDGLDDENEGKLHISSLPVVS